MHLLLSLVDSQSVQTKLNLLLLSADRKSEHMKSVMSSRAIINRQSVHAFSARTLIASQSVQI